MNRRSHIRQLFRSGRHLSLFAALTLMVAIFSSCSKKHDLSSNTDDFANDSTIIDPVDPPVFSTMGFFLDVWQSKTYVAPQYTEAGVASNPETVVTVDAANVITKIPLTIFGHNANNWRSF